MLAKSMNLQYSGHNKNHFYMETSTILAIIALFMLLNFFDNISALPEVIRVGALFHEDQRNSDAEIAFKYAIEQVNNDTFILPETKLVYDIQYVPKYDSFRACKTACAQIKNGIQAIFGPSSPFLATHIHSICDALDIPHLEMRIDKISSLKEFSINLHPSQYHINTAFQDFIRFLNWTTVGILFERHHGLLDVREISRATDLEVFVRQVDPFSYASVLSEFKNLEINNLIIDTNPKNISILLETILKLQMSEYKYHYFFTSFDFETFNLEDFKYNFVNMTSFRLIDYYDIGIKEILKDMEEYKIHQIGQHDNDEDFRIVRIIETEPALIYDSVFIFAIGLQTLENSHSLKISNLSCASEVPWDGGLSLINYINSVEWRGLTGPIQFKEGRRIQFKLDLVKLTQRSIVKIGEWTPTSRLNVTDRRTLFESDTMNVTLVVITILETPYVMMRYEKNFTGNERFYGFCVDILNLIARDVGFDYILDLVPDGKYGAKDPVTGEWNGMVAQLMKYEKPYVMVKKLPPPMPQNHSNTCKNNVFASPPSTVTTITPTNNDRFEGFCIEMLQMIANKVGFEYKLELVADGRYGAYNIETEEWNGIVRQLIDKKADLAVGSMTINYARESVIDFTKPFMNLGISILFKIPSIPPTQLFSFMNPLAVEIWLYVLAAYILASLTIYTVAKFTPFEWRDKYPCNIDSSILGNQFTIANSFWFTIGTLMQQGSDLSPKALSTRIVSAIWWFFTLIIISSYTANLAAFLTVERMITPIESADDLPGQTDISYGTLESGSTMTFFRDSMIETYRKMWRYMDNKRPSVFTRTYEEGIARVLQGNYAFLMESTMLDYVSQRDCNLTQIGGLLDAKGYGIATPMGSPWRDKISLAILELQEKGEIQMLYNKWWKKSGKTCVRKDRTKQSKASELGMDNIGGIFVVLFVGITFAVIVAIFEFYNYNQKQQRYNDEAIDNVDEEAYKMHRLSKNDGVLNESMIVDAGDEDVNNFNDKRHRQQDHRRNYHHHRSRRYSDFSGGYTNRGFQQTLLDEMTDEFCFALSCMGSRQKPAFKRQCPNCRVRNRDRIGDVEIGNSSLRRRFECIDGDQYQSELSKSSADINFPKSTNFSQHSSSDSGCDFYQPKQYQKHENHRHQ